MGLLCSSSSAIILPTFCKGYSPYLRYATVCKRIGEPFRPEEEYLLYYRSAKAAELPPFKFALADQNLKALRRLDLESDWISPALPSMSIYYGIISIYWDDDGGENIFTLLQQRDLFQPKTAWIILAQAIVIGNVVATKWLFEAGVEFQEPNFSSLFHALACLKKSRPHKLKKMIEKISKHFGGLEALFYLAVRHCCNFEMLKHLFSLGVNLNCGLYTTQRNWEDSILNVCLCRRASLETTQLLVENGADLKGCLFMCRGSAIIFRYLVEAGANVNEIHPISGLTVLHTVVELAMMEFLEILWSCPRLDRTIRCFVQPFDTFGYMDAPQFLEYLILCERTHGNDELSDKLKTWQLMKSTLS